jgi:hypothetical protein
MARKRKRSFIDELYELWLEGLLKSRGRYPPGGAAVIADVSTDLIPNIGSATEEYSTIGLKGLVRNQFPVESASRPERSDIVPINPITGKIYRRLQRASESNILPALEHTAVYQKATPPQRAILSHLDFRRNKHQGELLGSVLPESQRIVEGYLPRAYANRGERSFADQQPDIEENADVFGDILDRGGELRPLEPPSRVQKSFSEKSGLKRLGSRPDIGHPDEDLDPFTITPQERFEIFNNFDPYADNPIGKRINRIRADRIRENSRSYKKNRKGLLDARIETSRQNRLDRLGIFGTIDDRHRPARDTFRQDREFYKDRKRRDREFDARERRRQAEPYESLLAGSDNVEVTSDIGRKHFNEIFNDIDAAIVDESGGRAGRDASRLYDLKKINNRNAKKRLDEELAERYSDRYHRSGKSYKFRKL